MNTVYKVMTEVKVLHEYYLTEETGKTIFEYATQQERNDFLARSFEANRLTIANDISFDVLPDTAEVFGSHRLRVIPSYFGFKILVQVAEEVLADNSIAFRPVLPLPDGIIVGLKKKNTAMDAFTNGRISTALPSIFFFSNTGEPATKDFPILSARVPAFSLLTSYEQGELSLSSSGTVQSYSVDDNGNEQWIPVPGNGFVNEQDRVLVTPEFDYKFPLQTSVTTASFRLLDAAGQQIRTIEMQDSSGLRKVRLSFNNPSLLLGIRNGTFPKYTLQVSGNNYAQDHVVTFIGPEYSLKNYWGIVHLSASVDDEQFNLLDENGYLRTRKNPDGTSTMPQYFEIRIKSRPTFWQYVNEQGRKIKGNPTLDDFLKYDAVRGVMTSLSMRNASKTPTDFLGNGNARFLPHPSSVDAIAIEGDRIITKITVPRSDLFDV